MDYNNDPTTTFADIQGVFWLVEKHIAMRLPRPQSASVATAAAATVTKMDLQSSSASASSSIRPRNGIALIQLARLTPDTGPG